MTQFTQIDMALLGVAALLTGIGLFRGLSGELASLAGFAAAAAAVFFAHAYGFTQLAARSFGFDRGDVVEIAATALGDLIMAILSFGIARWFVNRFVSCLVPQPTNALLGALSGAAKSFALFVLLGIGFTDSGMHSHGYFATRSSIIGAIASFADSYCGEAS